MCLKDNEILTVYTNGNREKPGAIYLSIAIYVYLYVYIYIYYFIPIEPCVLGKSSIFR